MKVLQWNACSLVTHGEELKHFLYTLPRPDLLDILCIQEIRLNENIKFTIPGYAGEHRYCPVGAGGGVSTFMSSGYHIQSWSPPTILNAYLYKILRPPVSL